MATWVLELWQGLFGTLDHWAARPSGPFSQILTGEPLLPSGPAEPTQLLYITLLECWDGGRGVWQVGGALSRGESQDWFPLLNLPMLNPFCRIGDKDPLTQRHREAVAELHVHWPRVEV